MSKTRAPVERASRSSGARVALHWSARLGRVIVDKYHVSFGFARGKKMEKVRDASVHPQLQTHCTQSCTDTTGRECYHDFRQFPFRALGLKGIVIWCSCS